MKKNPTIVDVAKEASVSTSTVSQVMRGSGRISKITRDKVFDAAKKVNYQRNLQAAAMRSGQFKEIGLLINQIANPFNAEVIAGVSTRLETEGYLVFILDTQDELERQSRYMETLLASARGGLLWVPALGTDAEMINLVANRSIPTVTFLRQLPGATFDHVGIENAEATSEATEHLIQLGHEKIAFFGGIGDTTVKQQRIAGYLQAMSQLKNADTLIWPCRQTKKAAVEALIKLLQKHPDITAIVCSGDVVAMGATLALASLDKTAGVDLSIIGFDGTEEAALWTPALTTLTVNAFELGEQLAQTLLERIEKPDMSVRSINLSAHLEIRDTTGPINANQ